MERNCDYCIHSIVCHVHILVEKLPKEFLCAAGANGIVMDEDLALSCEEWVEREPDAEEQEEGILPADFGMEVAVILDEFNLVPTGATPEEALDILRKTLQSLKQGLAQSG